MNVHIPTGLHKETPEKISLMIKDQGFNCVRLLYSVYMWENNPIVHVDAIAALPESKTGSVRALQIFDRVIAALADANILIILDNHVSDPAGCCDPFDQNGLWFNERFPEEKFIESWIGMAGRYRNEPMVIGYDLRNEMRPDIRISKTGASIDIRYMVWEAETKGTRKVMLKNLVKPYAPENLVGSWKHKTFVWAVNSAMSWIPVTVYNWKSTFERLGAALLKINPDALIFLEGVFNFDSYQPHVMSLVLNYFKKTKGEKFWLLKYFDIPDDACSYFQTQNLKDIAMEPISNPDLASRTVFSTHLYRFTYQDYPQNWNVSDPAVYDAFSTSLDEYWGYLFKNYSRPIWIGEIGTGCSSIDFSPPWDGFISRYMQENDLDFGIWPISDSFPRIKDDGSYDPGSDGYGN